jgi:small subunit ribosomal protein S6
MEANVKNYEGMFLLEAGNPDFQAASEPVRGILTRYGAEILSFKPWDERKLAYEIRGRKRGLYVLVYFKADPLKIVEIEHDCELDERVLRQLILRRDKLTQEQIDAPTPASSIGHVESEPGAAAAPAAAVVATDVVIEAVPSIEEIDAAPEADEKA